MEKITNQKCRYYKLIPKVIYQSIDSYGFNEKQPKTTKIGM